MRDSLFGRHGWIASRAVLACSALKSACSCCVLGFWLTDEPIMTCCSGLQDCLPGGRGRPDSRSVLNQCCIQPPATLGGCSTGRLCVWLSLELDASVGQRAVRHAQICHAVLPAAVWDNYWDLCFCHQAGASPAP